MNFKCVCCLAKTTALGFADQTMAVEMSVMGALSMIIMDGLEKTIQGLCPSHKETIVAASAQVERIEKAEKANKAAAS